MDKGFYLELTPLSQITDEDAIEVAKLQDWKDYSAPLSRDDRYGIRDQILTCARNQWVNYNTVDYLRSKGYALPWLDITVEQQIEYGWIKLKNKQ